MRTENTTRSTRLLRVREFTEKVSKKPENPSAKGNKSRFVAPYYFKAQERSAIAGLLQEAQLSDDEGRQLFITAVEYEVGAYCRTLQEEPAPQPKRRPKPRSKTQLELATLGRSADQMLTQLRQTPKTAREALGKVLTGSDPFGREHGEGYFTSVELELSRIIAACGQDEKEPVAESAPPTSEASKKLIKQLMRIHDECLEVHLATDGLEVFTQILRIICDSAELALPSDAEAVAGLLREMT